MGESKRHLHRIHPLFSCDQEGFWSLHHRSPNRNRHKKPERRQLLLKFGSAIYLILFLSVPFEIAINLIDWHTMKYSTKLE